MNNIDYDNLIEMSAAAYGKSQRTGFPIDEISILFWRKEQFDAFVAEAIERGTRFAYSDEMQALQRHAELLLLDNKYETRYEFIWPEPYSGYRIEAMRITDGHSRLHSTLRVKADPDAPVIAHASFKLGDGHEYEDVVHDMKHFPDQRSKFMAEYKNGYGLFSYFGYDGLSFYVKPRVNTRD